MKKALLLGALLPAVATAQPKPNVIVIYIDDMGYSDPACFGGKFTPTPNIDRMAAEGVRLTQFYSASPISSPSRVALTTGDYPTRWGLHTFLNTRQGNAGARQQDFLSAQAPSLARVLQQDGYATGHFGKWHMGGGRDVDNAPGIDAYGFDEWCSTWESPSPDPLLTSSDWIWAESDSVKRWDRTGYFIDKTLDFARRSAEAGKPFYINLWPDDMHAPWVPSQDIYDAGRADWSKQKNFTPVLARLDRQLGRLMQALKKAGLDQNTVIVFTSDNGPDPSFNNTRTDGMRGQKASLYEGGIREPFFVRWPARIGAGQVDTTTVMCTVDLMPTLCALAGVHPPGGCDGVDMSRALLQGHVTRPGTLYWEFRRFKEPKKGMVASPNIAARTGDWKVLVDTDGTSLELYDLAGDRNETTNVADLHPDRARRMAQDAIAWYKKSFNQYVK